MKIIIFFNSMLPAGGIERVISKHIDFMSKQHDLVLITKDEGNSFYQLPNDVRRESLGIDFALNMHSRIKRISKISHSLLKTARALRLKFKQHKPDVVYVASPLSVLECFFAGMKLRNICVTEHSSISAYNLVYQLIISTMYRYVGLLTVPTKSDSLYYAARGIPNAYLPNPLPFYPEYPAKLSGKVALSVGRLTDDKQHHLLLDIWYASEISSAGWKLIIVGRGENKEFLLEKIASLGLGASVFIIDPTRYIQDVYMSSSLFLLTSRSEGFGLVLAEAMSCGVPCISFDCPSGPRDMLEEGVTGRLLKVGDVSGFIEALRQLSVDPALRQSFGSLGRLHVKKFHSKIIGRQFCQLLSESFVAHNVSHDSCD